jgi:hypothetical protein
MLSLFARGALRGRACTLPRSLPTPARAFTASARTPEPADAPATRAKKAAGGAEGGKTTRGRPKSSTPSTTTATKAATPNAKAKPGPKPKAKPGPKPKKAAPVPKARTRKAAPKPPAVRLTAADKPPKLPPTGFILFAKAHRAGQPITSLADARVLIKAAAGAWAALTPHEKQAFRDESAALRPGYDAQRAEWERTIDPAKFALMNKKRRAAGKVRIVRKNTGPPRPLSSFARYACPRRCRPPHPR